jgi:hypothetical protein
MPRQCGGCGRPTEFAQEYTCSSKGWHPQCFKCSICSRLLSFQPYHPRGITAKATVEASPKLFCTDCACQTEATEFVFSLYHTLIGNEGFGTKTSTLTATTSVLQRERKPISIVKGGNQIPNLCPSCSSPHWRLNGFEHRQCRECLSSF